MIYKIIYDRTGNPVLHSDNCFCPSMGNVIAGSNAQNEIDEVEAPDVEQVIRDFYADEIDAKRLSAQRAFELMRLGHCVKAPEGIGRRGGIVFGENIILNEKVIHAQSELEKSKDAPAKTKRVTSSNRAVTPNNSAPSGSHANCTHPATKSARAACRRARAKGSQ